MEEVMISCTTPFNCQTPCQPRNILDLINNEIVWYCNDNQLQNACYRTWINEFEILQRGFVLRDLVYSISDSNHLVPKCVFLSNIGRGNLFFDTTTQISVSVLHNTRETTVTEKIYMCTT